MHTCRTTLRTRYTGLRPKLTSKTQSAAKNRSKSFNIAAEVSNMHSHTQNIFLQRDIKVKSKTFSEIPVKFSFFGQGQGAQCFSSKK